MNFIQMNVARWLMASTTISHASTMKCQCEYYKIVKTNGNYPSSKMKTKKKFVSVSNSNDISQVSIRNWTTRQIEIERVSVRELCVCMLLIFNRYISRALSHFELFIYSTSICALLALTVRSEWETKPIRYLEGASNVFLPFSTKIARTIFEKDKYSHNSYEWNRIHQTQKGELII